MRQHGLAPRQHFAPQEARAVHDLLDAPSNRTADRTSASSRRASLRGSPRGRDPRAGRCDAQLLDAHAGCRCAAPEVAAIFGRVLAGVVEQIVADVDARQMDVGPQPAQHRLHVAVMRIQLIQLGIDVLRLARQRQHRHHDQQEEPAERRGGKRPGRKLHGSTLPGMAAPSHPLNGGGSALGLGLGIGGWEKGSG